MQAYATPATGCSPQLRLVNSPAMASGAAVAGDANNVLYKIAAVADRLNVVAATPQQLANPRRELLIEESLHPRNARSPAAAASKPRRYSASLSSISASISSWYSP